jgi:hypothetical protein
MVRRVFEMVKEVWISDEAGLYLVFTTVGGVIRYAQNLALAKSGTKSLYEGTSRDEYSDNTRKVGVKRLKEELQISQMTIWAKTGAYLMLITPGYLIKQGEKPEEIFE